MFDAKTNSLLAPRVKGAPLQIPLKRIYHAENRIHEVAIANMDTAPSLLADYNIGWLDAKDAITRLRLLLVEAKKASNLRKSIVYLDEAPRILTEKKLVAARNPAGSEDLRQAVLAQDKEYEEHQNRVACLEAMIELMENKAKAIEWAYTSVKKVYVDPTWAGLAGKTHRLSAGQPQAEPAEAPKYEPDDIRSHFGSKATT